MSAYEDDAGAVGDALADLVEAGALSDSDVLSYFAGDDIARRKVDAAVDARDEQMDS